MGEFNHHVYLISYEDNRDYEFTDFIEESKKIRTESE